MVRVCDDEVAARECCLIFDVQRWNWPKVLLGYWVSQKRPIPGPNCHCILIQDFYLEYDQLMTQS